MNVSMGGRWGVVLCALGLGCGPEPGPAASSEGSSAASETTVDPDSGESTVEPLTSTGATGTTGDGTTEGGSSTGEPVDPCPPRSFESEGAWRLVDPDEPVFASATTQSSCTFVEELAPAEPGTLELELSCEPTFEGLPAQLVLRLWAELEALPFAPGDPLQLAFVLEPDGAINKQELFTLRDPAGELLVAGFQGYAPMGKGPESAMFFDPLAIEQVDVGCLVPCEDWGCYTRSALDVTLGAETTRIYDGDAATVGEQPSYRVHVGYATFGSGGLDDWGQHVNVVAVRQP
jgi:hypothetical protein